MSTPGIAVVETSTIVTVAASSGAVSAVDTPTIVTIESQTESVAVVEVPTIVAVTAPGPQGPPGPAGPAGPPGGTAGQIRLAGVAGTALSGHRAVTRASNGDVVYASNTEATHLHAPLWVTVGAAAIGAPIEVIAYGVMEESTWSWVPGPLYLGANGVITQIPPIAPGALFLAQIGVALTPTMIWIDRRSSISLA